MGTDPDGAWASTRPDGVAKTRSWVKVTDITHRVRQRHAYKIVGAIELKGRRRYNFSLKSKPAMTYGYVSKTGADGYYSYNFVNGYAELNHGGGGPAGTYIAELAPIQRSGFAAFGSDPTGNYNPAWVWGFEGFGSAHPGMGYFYPGGDILATNMIENSSLSVEFFYGQTLTEVHEQAGITVQNEFRPEQD